MSTVAAPMVTVRDAVPGDNEALVRLAAACPMQGDVGLCVDREPDFFALNRLEGEEWRLGIAENADGMVVGCVAASRRRAYLHGWPTETMYVGDLKVDPAHRGGPAADALTEWVREMCRTMGGEDVPTLLTVLAGNHAMERRAGGPRGLPHLARFATVRSFAIPLLWSRRLRRRELQVTRAGAGDIEEMAALWSRVAPGRQFASLWQAEELAQWIAAAPGLEPSSYLLARRADGRLAGFLALWDQSTLKQLRVTEYSSRLAVVRAGFNRLAPWFGATQLPPPGSPLRYLTAVHLCVPPDDPGVLRSLLLYAYSELRGRGLSFLTVGLDVRDPLCGALSGMLAQPTDVHAYATTPAGRYTGLALDMLPLHYEIALV
ncbi:MAG: hypothetical protein M3434_09125 [Gemmatimonadota bacterium]|nr:hypothetical protein [Gemmatimonadota bacterium]